MGAFFLVKIYCEIDREAVENVFHNKGFSGLPLRRTLGNYELWLYKKQMVNTRNYIEEDDGYSVFATGTLVYKGLGYDESLKQLLNDFRKKTLSRERLLGNFCLLFWDGLRITFLTDEMNVHHIFIDEKRSRISTSFLALLASHTNKLRINKTAFFEKLATGYIISPDTLIEGIQEIDEDLKEYLTSECPDLIWSGCYQRIKTDYAFHAKGFKDSIERQGAVLKSYFQQVDQLHLQYHGELGLSSGYDSRLVLASACRFLSSPLEIHTHSTKNVHDFERQVAEEIAQLKNLRIHLAETKRIEEHDSDDIKKLLLEGVYFFDARCSYDMGAFSETYTGSYKKRVLGENRLSFNGLGGEIFRNHWFTLRKYFNTQEWMKAHVYYSYAEDAINDPEIFYHVNNNMIGKLSKRLQVDINHRMSFLDMRRYYSEIRMPDCDAINNNAQNQISFYLTPFMEPIVFREAIKATPYIGAHGKYQAELIRYMDISLASIKSHYGFSFDRIPLSYSVSALLKGYVPDKAKNVRHRVLKIKGRGKHCQENYYMVKRRSDYIKGIEGVFSEIFPNVNWQAAMCDTIQKATTIFLASFLNEFSTKLTW